MKLKSFHLERGCRLSLPRGNERAHRGNSVVSPREQYAKVVAKRGQLSPQRGISLDGLLNATYAARDGPQPFRLRPNNGRQMRRQPA